MMLLALLTAAPAPTTITPAPPPMMSAATAAAHDDDDGDSDDGAQKLVDLNSATAAELCTLPGIGPKKAEAIIAARARRPFVRVSQLLQVKGIGPRMLSRIKSLVTVKAPATPAAPTRVAPTPATP